MSGPPSIAAKGVIFDLDGVLIDSERLIHEVTGAIVKDKFGKTYEPSKFAHLIGRSPPEAVRALIDALELPCTVDEYLEVSQPMLGSAWAQCSDIPGAGRLVKHLHAAGVPIAVATSSFRSALAAKTQAHDWFSLFADRVVTSDDVQRSKPEPDIFLCACEKLGISPKECVVIEDSPSGIIAANAAGCYSVALLTDCVPTEAYDSAAPRERLATLFGADPASWGLPPFGDLVRGTAPRLPPLRLTGTVVKGFGRGSKELGIPTANLPASAYAELLSSTTCGIYHGWAQVDDGPVYGMVASVGRNPYYNNEEKTVEPHILNAFPQDFYGSTLRLLIVGYIRPESNFPSLEALIEAIHGDIARARDALSDPFFQTFRSDEVFVPQK